MKKLSVDDFYLLSEIVDKMGFEVPSKKEKTDEQFGIEIMVQLFSRLHRAKEPINKLVESVTGKKIEDFDFEELKGIITEMFSQGGVLRFFGLSRRGE